MKISRIFRMAAELYDDPLGPHSQSGCCHVIYQVAVSRYAIDTAQNYFRTLFRPRYDGAYWWASPDGYYEPYQRDRPLRVLALLLAAAVAESEGL